MSNPFDLANSFQNLGLQENRVDYHELAIEYPVLELILPEAGTSPCIRPPQNIEFREQPDALKYNFPQTGTDYIIRLPLASARPHLFPSNAASISTAIQNLSTSPGHSILQIASYSSRSDGESFIFRLVTENPVNGEYTIVTENDFSSLEWEAERISLSTEKWTRLAQDLINRSSDRAYFHVHAELRFYSWYLKSRKAERWGWAWKFGSAAGAGLVTCGHAQAISLRPMDSLKFLNEHSEEAINDLACETCAASASFASEEDLWQRRLFREAKSRVEFLAREGFWRKLEGLWVAEPLQSLPIRVGSKFLYDAIRHALPSIRMPDTACSRALQWVSSKEVTVAMLHLFERMDLSTGGTVEVASPYELEPLLLRMFEECLNGVLATNGRRVNGFKSLPDEWVSLLRLWFARTVMLVLVPGYDGRDIAGVFGEGGAEGLLVGDGVGEVMDELEAMFGNARLE
jgi:hypothetical protein